MASSDSRVYKRDDLLGKQVIGEDAKSIGTVKDIAYDGEGRAGFVVQPKAGEEAFVLSTQVIALGDVILVKSRSRCSKCGHINKETAKFCVKCGTTL
jgi:sporulation protein YlmC with PRC-barrel domain